MIDLFIPAMPRNNIDCYLVRVESPRGGAGTRGRNEGGEISTRFPSRLWTKKTGKE
jgi:hypothetical protein